MPDIDHNEEQRVFVNGSGRTGKHGNHLREESIEPCVVIRQDKTTYWTISNVSMDWVNCAR